MKLSDDQVTLAFSELKLQLEEFHTIRAPGPRSVMEARLQEFQDRVKKAYREAALRLHPDHNPDNPEAEELFKLVSEVVRQIQSLRVQERPRPRPRMVYSTTTSTGSTWTSNTSGGTIRINIKVR